MEVGELMHTVLWQRPLRPVTVAKHHDRMVLKTRVGSREWGAGDQQLCAARGVADGFLW